MTPFECASFAFLQPPFFIRPQQGSNASQKFRPFYTRIQNRMPETYTPSFDISSRFPTLRPKTTVILHPRQTSVDPPVYESKIGGHFYWPQTDPWPTCPVDGRNMCPVLQLTATDIPELNFPGDKDLFQMFWCPILEHEETDYGPFVMCCWRKIARDGTTVLLRREQVPALTTGFDDIAVPKMCTVSPERVDEYPSYPEMEEMDADAAEDVDEWISEQSATDAAVLGLDESENCYQYSWSVSPSTKVGGYVSWAQEVDHRQCDRCGYQMEHLLSIGGLGGYGGGGSKRWYPINESHEEALNGDGMEVYGGGNFYVFICRRCADMPTKAGGQR